VQAQDATYDPPNVPLDIIAPERPRGTPRQHRVITPDTTPPIAVLPLDPSPEAETAPQAPAGGVAGVVGIEGGVVSGVINLE
jgi:hypothetical protein